MSRSSGKRWETKAKVSGNAGTPRNDHETWMDGNGFFVQYATETHLVRNQSDGMSLFLEPNMRTSEISARASVRETQDRTVTRKRNTTPSHHSDSVQDEHRQ